ncbi:MAG: NADH-quinone oxidoreductase subunit NuoG [Pseudomonadota bacterium]|nr:NADH-quinone oxidoreductase subunit NuoG [Pseudomonadota bacterium]
MPKIFINDKPIDVENGITVLQACELAGIEIPRFCYHERLSIAGNCRMCLVEMENSVKPVASCAMPIADGMKIKTNSEMVLKARNGVMEFLLINHPLDCPICDQGGECDLQDQAMAYGKGFSRYVENKRTVKDKSLGPLIKTHMTRCIHCTRCIRFSEEIAGNHQLGSLGRGENTEITSYLEKTIDSELSGNVIDLCPVGALTSKPYAFVARPWELKKTNSIDVFDAVGSNIRLDSKGDKILRVLPRLNEEINQEWISDKTRFAYDGLNHQRIDRYYVRGDDGKLSEKPEETIMQILKSKFTEINSKKILSLVGNILDCESIFSFKLFLEAINAKNFDCRQDNSFFIPKQRFSYLFNSKISGIDDSDLCLLIGSDLRKEAPIVSARLRKRFLESDKEYPIIRAGYKYDLSFKTTEIGESYSSLINLGNKKFRNLLKKSKKPLFIIGQGPLCSSDSENLFNFTLDLYNRVSSDETWNGFNVLQTFSGRVGALDLEFFNKKNIKNNIAEEIYKGKYELLYLFGSDELDFNKIPKKTFVIYQGHHGDKAANRADLIIPTSCFTEKEGIYVNLEGRPQISRQVRLPISSVDHSWVFFKKLSDYMNLEINYRNFNELRNLMFNLHPNLKTINKISSEKVVQSEKFTKKFCKNNIFSNITNFYMTDSVSRNSPTMASCSMELNNKN